MSSRDSELLEFYREHRIDDQLAFYSSRRRRFDRAAGQALAISAMVLGFTSAASALAGANVGWVEGWAAVATILPAMAMALTAYSAIYAFEQQSKIYGDAMRAVHAASRLRLDPGAAEDIAELVQRVEAALRQEHAQWGQLTSQVGMTDQTKGSAG